MVSLTSFAEGSPLVFPEALSYGNFIITTDVSGAYETTNNEQFGIVIKQNDLRELRKILEQVIESYNYELVDESINFTKTNFNWFNILSSLEDKISKSRAY